MTGTGFMVGTGFMIGTGFMVEPSVVAHGLVGTAPRNVRNRAALGSGD